MQPEEIKNILQTVRSSDLNINERKRLFEKQYPSFVKQCPYLFEAICDDSFPLTFIDLMLSQITKLNNKEINTDDANNTVFTTLNKTYVDPMLDGTSTNDS